MRFTLWLLIFITSASWTANCQDADSLFTDLDDPLSFDDSLSIFKLIDSLMTMENVESSQLAVRLSYNSNVLSAGRTLGIEQFGLTPGISYYHKSGLYADVSAYYSTNYDPGFYLTTLTAGYLKIFSKNISLLANYDYYAYNFSEDYYVPYKHSVTVAPFIEAKHLTFRCDYSFYFGDSYANRIMPGVSYTYKTRKIKWVDRLSFIPSVYVLFGDQHFSEVDYVKPKSVKEAIANFKLYGTRFTPVFTDRVVFGLMNYAITAPITISKRNWMFNISYTYSVPKAVSNEVLTISKTGYISSSLLYYFDLGKKTK